MKDRNLIPTLLTVGLLAIPTASSYVMTDYASGLGVAVGANPDKPSGGVSDSHIHCSPLAPILVTACAVTLAAVQAVDLPVEGSIGPFGVGFNLHLEAAGAVSLQWTAGILSADRVGVATAKGHVAGYWRETGVTQTVCDDSAKEWDPRLPAWCTTYHDHEWVQPPPSVDHHECNEHDLYTINIPPDDITHGTQCTATANVAGLELICVEAEATAEARADNWNAKAIEAQVTNCDGSSGRPTAEGAAGIVDVDSDARFCARPILSGGCYPIPDPTIGPLPFTIGDIEDPEPIVNLPPLQPCKDICRELLNVGFYVPPEAVSLPSEPQSHVFLQSELPTDVQEQLRDAMRTTMRNHLESLLPTHPVTGPAPPEYTAARSGAIDAFMEGLEENLMDPNLPVLAIGT